MADNKRTLLLLGSKPGPRMPERSVWQDLACANASGRSAHDLALPMPCLTVISAIVTSRRKASNDLAVAGLSGLRTEALYFLPRPGAGRTWLSRILFPFRMWRCQPWFFRRRLGAAGYRWNDFRNPGYVWYLDQLRVATADDPAVLAALSRKQPSTGVFALVVALALKRWERIILSGFSFELTHAYAHNPSIDELGTTASKHAQSDIQVLRAIAAQGHRLLTTEPAVAEETGIPLL